MKKIWTINFLVILMLVACNTSTKQDITEEKTLTYGTTTAIEQLNPILTEEGHSELISLVYRGLMKQTKDNEVTGDIAQAFDVSEDELTYSFTLHDATWHDSEPVTADDVVFTLNSILSDEMASPYYSDFQTVTNVVAVDSKTVKITVSQPTPTLLHKLKVGLLPKHIYEQVDALTASENKSPIGNGPYVLESWTADDVLTFSAFESFYGTTPKIKQIKVFTKLDENTKLLRLQTGDLNLAQITPQQQSTVSKYDGITVKKLATADYRALQFNQQHPQLADVRVRTAINHFIERDMLRELVLKGTGEQAYGPLQHSFARYDSELYRFDTEAAKQLLQEAGYVKKHAYYEKDGRALAFEVVAPISDPIRVALATVIVEQLQQQGIDARLQTKDWSNITIEAEDTFMIGWGSEDDPDTHTYRVFHSNEHAPNGYNYALVDNPKIDAALTLAKSGTKEARTQAYVQFQQLLSKEMASSFLVYLDGIYAVSDEVVGITERTLGHNGFGFLWNIEDWRWEGTDE